MGILGDIFGSDSTTTTNQTTNSNTNTTNSTQTAQQQQTSSKQDTSKTGQAVTTALDQDTIDQIKGLVSGLSGQNGASTASTNALGDLSAFIDTLSNRAANEPVNLQKTIDAGQGKARSDFQQTTQAQINQAQQQVGSKYGNSFSQLLQATGNAQLDASLAKIASDATLQGTQQQSADYATIAQLVAQLPAQTVNAESGANSNLASLLGVLKGANTTSNTQDNSTSQLTELVNAILGSNAVGTNRTDSTTNATTNTSTASIFEMLPSVVSNTIHNAGSTGIGSSNQVYGINSGGGSGNSSGGGWNEFVSGGQSAVGA